MAHGAVRGHRVSLRAAVIGTWIVLAFRCFHIIKYDAYQVEKGARK